MTSHGALVQIETYPDHIDIADGPDLLLRMYCRWAEYSGYAVEFAEEIPGRDGGYLRVSFFVTGDDVYDKLRGEVGVHRIVRGSIIRPGERVHSVSTVSVYPDPMSVGERRFVPSEDIEVDTYRAGGPRGQHAVGVDLAVRVLHKPTGISAVCSTFRTQHQCREMAYRVVMAKLAWKPLVDLGRLDREVRLYVCAPYELVYDHRTGIETTDLNGIRNGGLDQFLEGSKQSGSVVQ